MWDFADKILTKPGAKFGEGDENPFFTTPETPGDFPVEQLPPEVPYPESPPTELDPINNPPTFEGGGGDLEPSEASGLSPEVIGKLPSWLQTLLRNGTLSPSTAASMIRQFVPDFKLPTGSPGDPTKGNPDAMDPMMLAAAMAGAWNHYKDSDRYMDIAEKYTDRLDPFGGQRGGYQEQLASLMKDPEGFVKNDPGYQSAMRLALNPVESKMRARGYGNSGNILTALTQVAGDTTNKYLGDLRKDLGNFAGAQFGPGAAAGLLNTGMQGSINSRNAALGDIFAGLRGSGASTGINNLFNQGGNWLLDMLRSFGGSPSGAPNPTTLPNIITDPDNPGFVGPPAPTTTIPDAPALDQNTPDSYFNKMRRPGGY